MRNRLTQARCWNHEAREAVANCPDCSRSFCRECVVEHEDRIICRGCLEKLASVSEKAPTRRRWNLVPIWRTASALIGVLVAWYCFFFIGRSLLTLPDEWHAETLLNAAIARAEQ